MKIFIIAATLAVLVGCGETRYTAASDGSVVPDVRTSMEVGRQKEFCYKGIVYVQFTGGTSGWGGARFDSKTLQPVTCGPA